MTDERERDRLLMLAPVMPSDRGNGLAMRAGFFLDTYSQRFAVDLVVLPVAGAASISDFVRARARRVEVLRGDRADSHYALLASLREPIARLEAFRRYGQPSLAAFSAPARSLAEQFAGETRYAAIHVFRLYLAELVSRWIANPPPSTRLILDCDENDALVFARIAALDRIRQNAGAAAWADAESAAFARMADLWLPKFDVVLAASRKEAKSLTKNGASALAVPNVAPIAPANSASRRGRVPTILFVGTLSYAPNADAVTWFVSRIWRRLRRQLRGRVRLMIVGRNPPTAIARLRAQPGIQVTGAVADVAPYYADADIVIAPLRAGGGTRIKIIEAAAFGLPILATSTGCEGMTFQAGRDMLVADDAANFLRACLLLLRSNAVRKRLGTQARVTARRDYCRVHWRARVLRLAAPQEHARSL
jgi:glycosyltransferase involved in cell wall biosynthesis